MLSKSKTFRGNSFFRCAFALTGMLALLGCGAGVGEMGDATISETEAAPKELLSGGWVTENPLLQSGDWPSAGHDWAHSGNNPAETELGVDTVGGMAEVWRHEFSPAPGVQVPVMSTPVIAGNEVYIADMGGFVHARNADDGTLIWTQLVSPSEPDPVFFSVFHSAPVVTDHDLYVGDSGSIIYKLDRDTGVTEWSTLVDAHPDTVIQSDLATVGPYVIFGVSSFENTTVNDLTMRGSIGALNKWNGNIAWQTFTTSDQSLANPKWGAGVAVWSSPAIDPLRGVYIGTGQYYEPGSETPDPESADDVDYSDSLLRLSLLDGDILSHHQFTEGDIFGLEYPIGEDADLGTPPNLFPVHGRFGLPRPAVGVGDKTGHYYVMDRNNLRVLWSRKVVEGGVLGGFQSTAAYDDGVIYVAAHERIDGASINDSMPPDLDSRFIQTPEGLALIQKGSRTHIMALDADTGDVIWDKYVNGAISFAPLVVANGVLYHANANGLLHAMDAANGDELFSAQIGGVPDGAGGFVFGNIITALSLAHGRVYVASVPIVPGAPVGVNVYGLP